MHLKTLTLTGFKSFADRTRIECEPGVTVVVGPNGSGKSNLVDAVAWAMGTQATTALRTGRMEDLIFAGTAVRPAVGRAEVSLTFDNGAGRVPLDMADVTITRRLFRDGTSEYEINGTPCRLLDIQELLGDSGVGRHQHVIVGQGRIDEVLNASADDHRAVIEEAAGVIKHRRRRERAVRRLEATDLDLERAKEILADEERRLRPLKRQANAAKRYDGLRDEWRSLRLWIGGEQLRMIRRRRAEIAEQQEEGTQRLDAATAERDSLTEALSEMNAMAGKAGEALERDRGAAARLETTAERLHALALLANERRIGVERDLRGVDARREAMAGERDEIEAALSTARDEEQSATETAERAAMTMRSLEDESRSLGDLDRLSDDGAVAALRGDLAALEAASHRDEREIADLTRRREAVVSLIEEEQAETERLGREVATLRDEASRAQRDLDAAVAIAARDAEAALAAEESWRTAEADAASAGGRLEALESAAAGGGDVRARDTALASDKVVGSLMEKLSVPEDATAAVRAALGMWASAFVAVDMNGIEEVTAAVKAGGLGGVSFVTAAAGASAPARVVAERTGVDALIDVLGPGADAELAATLFGDVVLVQGWAAGRRVVADFPEVRAVTPEGDVITAVGVVAADPDGAGSGALEEARVRLERAVTALARARSRRVTAQRASDTSAKAQRSAAASAEAAERSLAGTVEAIRLLERSRAEQQAEIDRIDRRLRALSDEAATRTQRTAKARERLAALDGGGADQEAWEDMARRRAEVTEQLDRARAEREQAAASLAAIAERRALLERRLQDVDHRLAEEEGPSHLQSGEALAEVEAVARRAVEIVRGHLGVLRDRERRLRSEVGDVGGRLDEARARRDELGELIEGTRETLSSLAVEAAEQRVREEAAAEALRRDVDASEDQALSAPAPEIPEGIAAEAHLDSLAASLRRLGPVNPLAAAEYEQLAERVEFTKAQLEDLERSRSELTKVIRALDEEIARLFIEAFEEISGAFAENFSLLFPGGAGRLTLTNPDEPLTTGVDIHAQPMGKKVGRLTLLSGGERSLAALAFLFAVFRARPSPFYVLDEVEAALDDANLRRFIRLVASVRSTSQLVIVTHQQQTMEAADILYGVTMEPGESSRVLAKRLAPV